MLVSRSRLASILAALLIAAPLMSEPAAARDQSYADATEVQDVMTEALAGDPSRQVVIQHYTIEPGVTLPWHTHPDAQEFVYVIAGPFAIEVQGKAKTELKTGDSFYLAPNLVHRGINIGASPAQLYTIRIKPKDAAEVQEIDKPQQ